MKLLVIFFLYVASAMAKDEVELISHEAMVEHNGKFHYHYELGDGSKASQDGVLKHVEGQFDGEAIQGQFAYVGDDGQQYHVKYTADEHGYRPVGAHLPTPPPVPESVKKTLQYLAEHPFDPEAVKNKKPKKYHG